MGSQIIWLAEAADLLGGLLEEWTRKRMGSPEKEIRKSYINRQAWNIHDIARDVVLLSEAGSLGSIYLLSRPALESLFKLSAAVKKADFAAEKAVSEIEEDRERIRRWRDVAEPGWITTLDELLKGLDEFGVELRSRYGITGQGKYRSAWSAAEAGELEGEYVRDYFVGSKHVHATLSALTVREEPGVYIPEGIYRLTVTVAHAAALVNEALITLENCAAPKVFDSALEIQKNAWEEFDRASAEQEAALKAKGY